MAARILIVEDERIIQLDLKRQVERLGHEVVGMATRGEEAVARAMELKPDLVLMDVRLDGAMDGIEAAQLIRAAQHTPVIYVTGNTGMVERAKQEEPAAPWLSKPFRTAELAATIERTLALLGNGKPAVEKQEEGDI